MDGKLNKSKRQHYEEAELNYENAIAERYNRDYHDYPIMETHSKDFSTFVGQFFHSGDRVLDLGCGSASMWKYWQQTLTNADQLVGIDLSPGMIDEARRLYPNGDFRIGSFFNIPAESGSFDMVIVSSAFHHILDEDLPTALKEIHRVLDEHGILVGREPLSTGRIGDRGGWLAGALMQLRHLAFRLTHTREYPEPDPGPAHHAYDAQAFLDILSQVFHPMAIEFRNPISHFLSRVRHPTIAKIATLLDNSVSHKEGQEILYTASKNYSTANDVQKCIRATLEENKIEDLPKFLAMVEASSIFIESELADITNQTEKQGRGK